MTTMRTEAALRRNHGAHIAHLAWVSLVSMLAACTAGAPPAWVGSDAPPAYDLARRPVQAAGGAIQIFFTRPGTEPGTGEDPELDDAVAAAIAGARSRVDLCLFEFNRDVIVDAVLAAHRNGVEIRFVGDGDEREDSGYARLVEAGVNLSLRPPRDRIMHNKFAVIDDRWVWTGSTNFSQNGVLRNNNNSLLIDSPELAASYVAEFEQMYDQARFGRKKGVPPSTAVVLGDESLDPHFSPEDPPHEAILSALDTADRSVFFTIFSFTRKDIADRLIALHERGVQVMGIFDESQARGRYSRDEALARAGIPILLDGNHNATGFSGGKLHHKVLIVDAGTSSHPTVVTGSYNWSTGASRYNDENILVIDGPEVSTAYLEEFCRMVAIATPHPENTAPILDPCASLLEQVRINEVMANPAGPDRGSEWVELVNLGQGPVDLAGWMLGDAQDPARHRFGPLILEPGAALVVGESARVAAPALIPASSGRLGLANNAEEVVLRQRDGRVVDRMGYQRAASGVSFNRTPDGASEGAYDYHDVIASAGASPGLRADGTPWAGPSPRARLVINEVLPDPAGTDAGHEFVEIVNLGPVVADLSGMTLSDAGAVRHVFPAGTRLPPHAAIVVFDSGVHDTVPGWTLASTGLLSLTNTGDTLTLRDATGRLLDQVSWSASRSGVSLNRAPDTDRAGPLVDHDTVAGATAPSSPGLRVDGASFDAPDAAPRVFFNEVLPNPAGTDLGNEYVEIVNGSATTADLSGWTVEDQAAVRHVFAAGTTLAPGAALVLYDRGTHSDVPGALLASTGTLSLNNAGETLVLRDAGGARIATATWSSSVEGESLNRRPDGDPDAPLAPHATLPRAAGVSSPGLRADGAPWP